MESTQENRVWHSGPPPHVGWWNASRIKDTRVWSWWDGVGWSNLVADHRDAGYADHWAGVRHPDLLPDKVEWNDYWPADARVPRLAPEDFEVGSRWVCVKPLFTNDFVGMELRVSCLKPHTLEWDGPISTHVLSLSLLPDEHYVPRRCTGPQTRWDFPMLKGSSCLDAVANPARGQSVVAATLEAMSRHARTEALNAKCAPKEPAVGSRWKHRSAFRGSVFEVLAVTNFSEIVGRRNERMRDYVLLQRVSGTGGRDVFPVGLRSFLSYSTPA